MYRSKLNILKKCIGTEFAAGLRLAHSAAGGGGEGRATALVDFHIRNGGKMTNFGGYLLPIQYADQSIIASHLHTRENSSIFDVSHMLQTHLRGKDVIACFEQLTTADIQGAKDGTSILTVFTNDAGGIYDDLIVTKVNDRHLFVVSNASMKEQDTQIMETAVKKFQANGKDVAAEFMDSNDQSLIALQGPLAAEALQKLLAKNFKLADLYFMQSTETEVAGLKNCRVTRCGYTGEDGFEISVPSTKVEHVTEALLKALPDKKVRLAGLGARDSLRLEAGLCLYGNDIDQTTTPIEAGLAWLVAKRRRETKDFPGAQKILNQLQKVEQVERRRVGFQMLPATPNPAPARAGSLIYSNDAEVGRVTSGCPSPNLKLNIAMGYIKEAHKNIGNSVQLKVRDKFYEAKIVKMPFVTSNYYVKPRK